VTTGNCAGVLNRGRTGPRKGDVSAGQVLPRDKLRAG
jgi:hypothetical protein